MKREYYTPGCTSLLRYSGYTFPDMEIAAKVFELWIAGKGQQAIADKLGISRKKVRNMLPKIAKALRGVVESCRYRFYLE